MSDSRNRAAGHATIFLFKRAFFVRAAFAEGILRRKLTGRLARIAGIMQFGFLFKGGAKHPAVCAIFSGRCRAGNTIQRKNKEGKVWQQIKKSESS
jgi:hypothetical protein